MLLELGNAHPQDVFITVDPDTGARTERRVDLPGPLVTYVDIADYDYGPIVGLDRLPGETDEAHQARHDALVASGTRPGPVTSFPQDHRDEDLNDELAMALASIEEGPGKWAARRLLINAHMTSREDLVTHLPNHEIFVATFHPRAGTWRLHAAPDTVPTWVHCPGHPGFEAFVASLFGVPSGRPVGVEDTHFTQIGGRGEVFPPGSHPPPDAGITAMHTSWGRDLQALAMFAWGAINIAGTATATSATSLTGGTETGALSHVANDSAGMILEITAPSGDAGKYSYVFSNTSGTSPVYTVDRWYSLNSPGGAAAATPSATATYTLVEGGASRQYVALTTDSTTPSLGGSSGTADAPAATTALTSEIATAGGGLIRKLNTSVAHSAGAATFVATITFTANGTDSLPVTVAKAAMCASIVKQMLGYMTLVSPTATLSASGDQLTLTWTFTET